MTQRRFSLSNKFYGKIIEHNVNGKAKMANEAEICIVGAGASGLTLAYLLIKAGKKVALLERANRVGGLAKSFQYEDQHTFDTGPKRFHTKDPQVLSFIQEIAGLEIETIDRRSALHYQNRIIDWPLGPQTLLNLPISLGLKSILEQLFFPYTGEVKNFENLVSQRYGKSLAEQFFRPYTEKFLKIPATQTHFDWAQLGINRTVIDREVTSILSLAKDLIPFNRKKNEQILYPNQNGFGGFFDKIFAYLNRSENFSAILGQAVESLKVDGQGEIQLTTSHSQQIQAKQVVWTGNLNQLLQSCNLSLAGPPLKYLNTLLFNIVIKKKFVSSRLVQRRIQWLYISSGERLISRISFPFEFHNSNQPEDYYNFCIEVTTLEDAQSLQASGKLDKLKNQVLQELIDLGFIAKHGAPEALHLEFIADSYPIYDLTYRQKFAEYQRLINQLKAPLILCGRSGAFWYNNSDHSIKMAHNVAHKILSSMGGMQIFVDQEKDSVFS